MRSRPRPPRLAVLALAIGVAAGPAAAGPAEDAEALNAKGKQLFAEEKYEEALARFRAANEIHPEGRFYFNVCFALGTLQRYAEAIAACEEVEAHAPDAALREKTQKALASLREKVPAGSGGGATTGGTTDGGPPPATGGGISPAPAAPATVTSGPDPFRRRPGRDEYRWALGVELGGANNRGVGRSDGIRAFAKGGVSLRVFGDVLLDRPGRFGIQGSVALTDLGPGADSASDDRLRVVDVGVGVFKSFRLSERVFLTPLAGAALAVLQPDTLSEGFIAGGGRLELGLAYVLGEERRHAIGLTIGGTIYSPAGGSVGPFRPADFDLDHAGTVVTAGVAYRFRFKTPFGQFVKLE